jgi:hypothetical protein
LGAVIEKNIPLLNTPLQCGMLTATKHANGEDWWILLNDYDSNLFYSFLITEEEPLAFESQSLGMEIPHGLGQAVFSPDGTKYACISLFGGAAVPDLLSIYDFDRCTGLLSNSTQFVYGDSAWSGGVAISPNSRYLYVSHYNYIFQFDLFANDIQASKDTVAIYDGYEIVITPTFTLPTRFFLMQLGPDGRIYINCPTSGNLLHVINNPDAVGVACDVQQHSVELPTYNLFSLPNFPNYRLGPLPDGACDTTTTTENLMRIQQEVSIYPNPATDRIKLSFISKLTVNSQLIIYTISGQQVAKYFLVEGQDEFLIDVSKLNQSLYFYEIRNINEIYHCGKISIF